MIRRLVIAAALVAAVVAVVLLVSGGSSSAGGYQVRAIFDNGAFVVPGEQVRIAGANAGKVNEVGVTMPGDPVGYHDGKPVHKPGKAIVVMSITNAGFQDFRRDATCMIRPQSLIGEKFVDCRPTLPRAPGEQPPPPLKKIPDGEPGAGQYLLPLGSSGSSVDPDLVNDIQSLPYAQRFRLILNELGGGLAGRGKDVEVLVKRANPALRDIDRFVAILAAQRDELAQLASNSEEILGPLSRERAQLTGFLSNAGAAGQASSEKGPQLEAALRKLPAFLTEFRKTMVSLGGFSEAATPTLADLGKAAPALTDATRTLTPWTEALTTSLKALGDAGEASGPLFAEADPVVVKAGTLAKSGVVPTRELAATLADMKQNGGWDGLVELIYNGALAFNGFDQYGHYGRALVLLSTCVDYEANRSGYSGGGCTPRFNGPNASTSSTTSAAALYRLLVESEAKKSGGTFAPDPSPGSLGQSRAAGNATRESGTREGEAGISESSRTEGTEPLLDYLLGP